MAYGIGIDIGTSGLRALSLDLDEKKAIKGVSTAWHPLPGSNLMDHLTFAATFGQVLAHRIMIKTVNQLLQQSGLPDSPEMMAVCGNPAQLSIFAGVEIRDLLFSPDSLERKGIKPPRRGATTIEAAALGLKASCDVLVPPAIKAEVGADAVALINKAGLLSGGTAIATDYGTNAEMALAANGKIFVGSAAAGPALEGQHIRHGMLAAPGAIADIEFDWGWKLKVLDDRMKLAAGDTIDIRSGRTLAKGDVKAAGITGTGVVALVSTALATGMARPPRLLAPGGRLPLQDGIDFSSEDLIEAGKAFGAIEAGHATLAACAGIGTGEIRTCHLSGTAGAYMDPLKARDVRLVPPGANRIVRHGNTSLEMACDLAAGEERLQSLQLIADSAEHVAFSASETFKESYIRELSCWCEGAPRERPETWPSPEIIQVPERWIPEETAYIRPQYHILARGDTANGIKKCPGHALVPGDGYLEVDLRRCRGVSCLRCRQASIDLGQPII